MMSEYLVQYIPTCIAALCQFMAQYLAYCLQLVAEANYWDFFNV